MSSVKCYNVNCKACINCQCVNNSGGCTHRLTRWSYILDDPKLSTCPMPYSYVTMCESGALPPNVINGRLQRLRRHFEYYSGGLILTATHKDLLKGCKDWKRPRLIDLRLSHFIAPSANFIFYTVPITKEVICLKSRWNLAVSPEEFLSSLIVHGKILHCMVRR